MTAQACEKLVHRGEVHAMCTTPLGPLAENNALPIKFFAATSSLWRGYIGTWVIEKERLYLQKLEGHILTAQGEMKPVGLDALFPDYPDGVFAHWFSGTLRCPMGALLKYVHGGFASTYEQDIFIEVDRGVVTSERVVRNGTAPASAVQGYVLGATTNF